MPAASLPYAFNVGDKLVRGHFLLRNDRYQCTFLAEVGTWQSVDFSRISARLAMLAMLALSTDAPR